MNKVEIDIVETKALERGVNSLRNTLVPGVVKLGGNPDLTARNTRLLDTLSNLGFVTIGKSTATYIGQCERFRKTTKQLVAGSNLRIDVTVALQESILDGLSDLVGLGLPGTKADGGDLVTGVEGVNLPMKRRECD